MRGRASSIWISALWLVGPLFVFLLAGFLLLYLPLYGWSSLWPHNDESYPFRSSDTKATYRATVLVREEVEEARDELAHRWGLNGRYDTERLVAFARGLLGPAADDGEGIFHVTTYTTDRALIDIIFVARVTVGESSDDPATATIAVCVRMAAHPKHGSQVPEHGAFVRMEDVACPPRIGGVPTSSYTEVITLEDE